MEPGFRSTVTIGPQCSWKRGFMNVSSRIGIPFAVCILMSASLGGCITSNASSSLMDAHAEAPKPPKPPSASPSYMAVEDGPSDRKAALTADEQSKLKSEMIAVRERQKAAAK